VLFEAARNVTHDVREHELSNHPENFMRIKLNKLKKRYPGSEEYFEVTG
jgi:hypothetical protein